jgi:hypothetical protein
MPTPLHLRLASARFVHTTSADTIMVDTTFVDTMSGLGIASDTAFPSATFTEPLSATPIEPSSTPAENVTTKDLCKQAGCGNLRDMRYSKGFRKECSVCFKKKATRTANEVNMEPQSDGVIGKKRKMKKSA